MSERVEPVRASEVEAAIDVAEAEAPEAVARLAYEVVARQAEGRTLFAGKDHVASRAEALGARRETASTKAGNAIDILERGARTNLERALVGALAVRGLGLALDEAEDEPARRSVIFRFVGHADWLETSSPLTVLPFVDALLSSEAAGAVWAEVAQAIVDDAAGRDGDAPAVRARNAARLSALAASSAPSATEALERVLSSAALDEPTRSLAGALAGQRAPSPTASVRVRGRLGPKPVRGALRVLRYVSGYAIALWLVRALAFLLGVRRPAEIRLSNGEVEVRTETQLLGRTIRVAEERWRLEALSGAGRQVRFPSLHLIVGALALSAGLIFGGLVLFDGVRSGELILVLLAAAMVLGGAGLDLGLDLLVPGHRGRVSIHISTAAAALHLADVPLAEADAFLASLKSHAARRA